MVALSGDERREGDSFDTYAFISVSMPKPVRKMTARGGKKMFVMVMKRR